MSRRTPGVTVQRAGLSLWLAGATLMGISCRGDEIAGPTEPGTASEATPVLETQTAHPTLTFIQISAGTGTLGAHSCGVTTDDRIYCWGSNTSGQLGNGALGFEVRPVAVASNVRFRSVAAGHEHTCAVAMDRRAYCWGEGATGALGDGVSGAGEFGTIKRTRPPSLSGGSASVTSRWGILTPAG